jgi:ubiquinone/menaquinone biosynthesis C-methylase UbiE
MAKDLFSEQASVYAKYRPTYPQALFDYILRFVQEKKTAWDCGTGNGQAASALANYFEKVEATDISESQLKNGVQKENIHYQIAPAENTPFADNSFDLITVATAYHWLNWKAFHAEATRVGKPNAVIAVWAYNIVQCEDEAINQLIQHFYYDVIYTYWDKERRYVEQSYQTVEFDFAPLPSKDFFIERQWNKEELLGYISSWSSVQNYQNKNGTSPISIIEKDLKEVWTADESKSFRFPLFLKIGRITK